MKNVHVLHAHMYIDSSFHLCPWVCLWSGEGPRGPGSMEPAKSPIMGRPHIPPLYHLRAAKNGPWFTATTNLQRSVYTQTPIYVGTQLFVRGGIIFTYIFQYVRVWTYTICTSEKIYIFTHVKYEVSWDVLLLIRPKHMKYLQYTVYINSGTTWWKDCELKSKPSSSEFSKISWRGERSYKYFQKS